LLQFRNISVYYFLPAALLGVVFFFQNRVHKPTQIYE